VNGATFLLMPLEVPMSDRRMCAEFWHIDSLLANP